MVLVDLPLADEHDDEESGHDKLNALGVEVDDVAQQGSCRGPGHPINLVQDGHKKQEPAGVYPLRSVHRAVDGERLVAQAEDEIGLFPAQVFEFIQQGQPVKQMPRVDHDGQEEGVDGLKRRQHQKTGGDELHRTGKNE